MVWLVQLIAGFFIFHFMVQLIDCNYRFLIEKNSHAIVDSTLLASTVVGHPWLFLPRWVEPW